MKWTTEQPTKPGWYWYKDLDDPDYGNEICFVSPDQDPSVAVFLDDIVPIENLAGEWSNEPIAEPEEA